MMRLRLLVAVGCVSVFAHSVHAQRTTSTPPADSVRMAAVTYLSGQSVYVGAGRVDGIREGMSLEVLRGGAVIATIRAIFLSSHSSSCEIVSSTTPPLVGDSVRYRPVADATAIASASSPADSVSTRRASWQRPIRGHVGLRYLSLTQPNLPGGASSFTQPSADVRVDATQVGGTSVGFVIDSRSRRTIGTHETAASALDQRTLIYEASISMTQDASGLRMSLGRQYSAALSSVSLFDGLTVEMNRTYWGVGAFGGLEPDVATMGYSNDVREAGGYVQLHNAPGSTSPWSLTTGAVDSRDLGQLNRRYAFAQVVVNGPVLSLYGTQEVDFNSGWKRTAGEPSVSPTSSFVTMSVRASDELSIQGGVDNRRNVRLYRDYISPETEFDDTFREGVWGGATLSLYRRIRIGGDARMSRGGTAGSADYYTGSLSLGPFTSRAFDAHLRSTRFATDRSTGWLHSWSVGASPVGPLYFELNGGLRTEQVVASPTTTADLVPQPVLSDARWIGVSLDLNLGRSWFLMASGTRDGAGVELTNQLYAGLVFRF